MVTLRLQRFRLKLQGYALDVRYKPGSKLYIADTLYRASIDDGSVKLNDESELQVNMIYETYNMTDARLTEIIAKTQKDGDLQELKEFILKGWPENKKLVCENIRSY